MQLFFLPLFLLTSWRKWFYSSSELSSLLLWWILSLFCFSLSYIISLTCPGVLSSSEHPHVTLLSWLPRFTLFCFLLPSSKPLSCRDARSSRSQCLFDALAVLNMFTHPHALPFLKPSLCLLFPTGSWLCPCLCGHSTSGSLLGSSCSSKPSPVKIPRAWPRPFLLLMDSFFSGKFIYAQSFIHILCPSAFLLWAAEL